MVLGARKLVRTKIYTNKVLLIACFCHFSCLSFFLSYWSASSMFFISSSATLSLSVSWFILYFYMMSVRPFSNFLSDKTHWFRVFPIPNCPLTPCIRGACELLNLENITRMNLLTTNWSIFYCSFLLVSGFYNIWNCRASCAVHVITI